MACGMAIPHNIQIEALLHSGVYKTDLEWAAKREIEDLQERLKFSERVLKLVEEERDYYKKQLHITECVSGYKVGEFYGPEPGVISKEALDDLLTKTIKNRLQSVCHDKSNDSNDKDV